MQLEWFESNRKNDEGHAYTLHFLYDADTSRIYGYVETPTTKESIFCAVPFHYKECRWYLTVEAAKDFLKESAFRTWREEFEEFTKMVEVKPTPAHPEPEKQPVANPCTIGE